MKFSQWKKKFHQDLICENTKKLELWFTIRNIEYDCNSNLLKKNQPIICKQIDKKIYLISYFLIMNVKELSKNYSYHVYSLRAIKGIIFEEYFKIFGNLCQILEYNTRVMEYPVPKHVFKNINDKKIYIQKITIFATVQQIWKKERSSIKINRFFWNNYHDKILMIPEAKEKNFQKLDRTFSYSDLSVWACEEYHEKIIEYFVKEKPKNQKDPRLVLIFGLPGSGKNWVLEKRRKKNHVIINMDDCRALLPKYWKTMITKVTGDWIKLFHDECNAITRKIFNYAISNHMHIVWNGTGKNQKKYSSLISIAKKNGYIIELKYVWVPLDLAKSRVKKRMIKTGRNVPNSIIIKAKEKIPRNFNKLLIETDYARIFENQSKSPKMIWDKYQGWDTDYTSKKSDIF